MVKIGGRARWENKAEEVSRSARYVVDHGHRLAFWRTDTINFA